MPPGTRNALVPPSPNYLQNAGQFVGGVGRGLSNQFVTGPLELVQQSYYDPYALGQGVVQGVAQFAQDPVGAVGNSLRSMWTRAKSSPAGLGEVVGENIDPRNFLKSRKVKISNVGEIPAETLEIPSGKSKRVTRTVPRYWYHSLRGRELGDQGQINPYEYFKETSLLRDELYRDPKPAGFVYLSPTPFSEDSHKIDVSKLDKNLMRLTGQSEGYAVYGGPIPASAIVPK